MYLLSLFSFNPGELNYDSAWVGILSASSRMVLILSSEVDDLFDLP